MNSLSTREVYLVFGVSGSGKSSTINTLCGETKCKVGDDETSETQNCKLLHVTCPSSNFYGKSLLDMQGYNDNRLEHTQEKIFRMMKLYFLEDEITTVKCIIFVINMSDTKTNFYRRFAHFLGQLFTEEQVERNSLVLLTQSDKLSDYGWSMEVVEWSNVEPFPEQDKSLLDAISHLLGFDAKLILEQEEKNIDEKVEQLFESEENILWVNHNAQMELREYNVDRLQEEYVVVTYEKEVSEIVPARTVKTESIAEKTVHFEEYISDYATDAAKSFMNTFGRVSGVLGINHLVVQYAGTVTRTQTKELEFHHPVLHVRFNKSPDDVHLLDRLDYEINSSDRTKVTVYAYFSWGGSPILEWDFYMTVIATIELIVVVNE
ncbi:unnamed protein product [Rotaria sp. Silwood2]|nr:unnamed protein product [Rotaria sp. Silwood2]